MTDDDSKDQPDLSELISLQKASEISGLSLSFLRRLVSNGGIWGIKIGRNWVTTEQAVRKYLASDRKPGRKPISKSR